MLVAEVMTIICMMTVSDNNADDDCYDGDADDGEDLHRKALSFHGYQWH